MILSDIEPSDTESKNTEALWFKNRVLLEQKYVKYNV